ncbi:hypothetical protein ACFW7J_22800 [Streptomyces sp. NPDC059525]|uniref:hypothetical protein n=1 Tax=Streptomyces sp. NPDC059525 TaxID=3346857 RepID=UPI00368C3352
MGAPEGVELLGLLQDGHRVVGVGGDGTPLPQQPAVLQLDPHPGQFLPLGLHGQPPVLGFHPDHDLAVDCTGYSGGSGGGSDHVLGLLTVGARPAGPPRRPR